MEIMLLQLQIIETHAQFFEKMYEGQQNHQQVKEIS